MKLPLAVLGLTAAFSLSGLPGAAANADAPATTTSTTSSTSSSTTTTSAAGDATREFVDARERHVEVPAHPQRVVTLSEPTLDGALALGVEPVGAVTGRGQTGTPAYLGDAAADIMLLGTLASPNYEQIAAVDPDLILVDGTAINDDAVLHSLSQIAPTVWLSAAGDDWQTAFAALGDVLNREERADDVLADYERRVAAIAAGLGPNRDATVSIVRWGLVGPAMILEELPASRVVADVGLRRPPAQARSGLGHSEPVPLELLDSIDADWMFFGSLGTIGTAPAESTGVAASAAALERAVETPGFDRLAVYRNDRIVLVDGAVWTSAGGPIAAGLVLDDIEGALVAGASDGAPSTTVADVPTASAPVSPGVQAVPQAEVGSGREVMLLNHTIAPGGTIRFTGSGYVSDIGVGQTVVVKLDDNDQLGQFEANADGEIAGAVEIPEVVGPGRHWLRFLAGAGKPDDFPASSLFAYFDIAATADTTADAVTATTEVEPSAEAAGGTSIGGKTALLAAGAVITAGAAIVGSWHLTTRPRRAETRRHRLRGRRLAVWAATSAVAVVAVVLAATLVYAKVINRGPSAFSDADLAAALGRQIEPDGSGTTPSPATGTSGITEWTITDGSEVGYRVVEQIRAVDTVGVGRTSDITGTVTIDGTTVTAATFDVDVASITSNDSRRDRAFRGEVMDTDSFPTATFTLTEPVEVDTEPVEGAEVTTTVGGELTLRGVTRPVTFELTARVENGLLGVLGSVHIEFADFGIDNPSNAVVSTEDHGLLEFILVLAPQTPTAATA